MTDETLQNRENAPRRFLRDRRGVAAVEFALIVPILLVLYFMTMEIAQAIDINKKVSRIASQVADLVTQQKTVTPAVLDSIMKISVPILAPYGRSAPVITVTAIMVSNDKNPEAEVVWSRRYSGGSGSRGLPAGTKVTVPESLMTPGAFFVRAETELEYWPVIAWSAQGLGAMGIAGTLFPIDMGERYFLRPRHVPAIPCSSC